MQADTKASYGTISKIFHWLIAISIISLLAAGFIMTNLDKSPLKYQIYGLHKAFGITVLAIAILRIIWRIIKPKPALPEAYPKWQRISAAAVHGILYLLTIMIPLSGWIMSMAANFVPSWFGLFQLRLPISPNKALAKFANNTHELLAWVLLAALTLHILAALKEREILRRMLPKS